MGVPAVQVASGAVPSSGSDTGKDAHVSMPASGSRHAQLGSRFHRRGGAGSLLLGGPACDPVLFILPPAALLLLQEAGDESHWCVLRFLPPTQILPA